MQIESPDRLVWAVVQTVTYSDIFDYPLTAEEIRRYLTGVTATQAEVDAVLALGLLGQAGPHFSLRGREPIALLRTEREQRSRALLPAALRFGRLLGSLPFVRMVALTGSLAVLNVSKNPDFDYLLVTAPGRVWTARAFAIALNRLVRPFGHTLCPNLIISENALEWPLHDLYSAREFCQMRLITGRAVYRRLVQANSWIQEFLPNADPNMADTATSRHLPAALQLLAELPLRGRLGDRLEAWEMGRKIARFSQQPGFGEETVFTAEVCQGNFHHHRKWTREVFEQRLAEQAAVFQPRAAWSGLKSRPSPLGAARA